MLKLLFVVALVLATCAAARPAFGTRSCSSKKLVAFLYADELASLDRTLEWCGHAILVHEAQQERRQKKQPVPKAMRKEAKRCRAEAKAKRSATLKRLRASVRSGACAASAGMSSSRARKCAMAYGSLEKVEGSVWYDPRRALCVRYTTEHVSGNVDGDGWRALVQRGGALCIDPHGAPHSYDPARQLCVSPETGEGGLDFHMWHHLGSEHAPRCTVTGGDDGAAAVRCTLGVLCDRPADDADVADVAHCRGQCYRKSRGECHFASRHTSTWYELCDTAAGEHWCDAVQSCRARDVPCSECEKIGWRPCAAKDADRDEKMRSCVDPVWAGCSCTSNANWGSSECTASYRREPKWSNAIEGGEHAKTTPYAQQIADEDAKAEWRRKLDEIDARCEAKSQRRCGVECTDGSKQCLTTQCMTYASPAGDGDPGCYLDVHDYDQWKRAALCDEGEVFCANKCRKPDAGVCHQLDRDVHVPGAEFERWCKSDEHWCAHEGVCRKPGKPCDRCRVDHKHSVNKDGVKSAWKRCGHGECYDARWAKCNEDNELVYVAEPLDAPGAKKNPYKAQLAYQQRAAEKVAQCTARGESFKVCGVDTCFDESTERCDARSCYPPMAPPPGAKDDKPKLACSAKLGYVKQVRGTMFERARVCPNKQDENGNYIFTPCGTKCYVANEGKCHWQPVPSELNGERDSEVWCSNDEQHCAAAGCCIAAEATCSAEATCLTAKEREAIAAKKKAAAEAEDKEKQLENAESHAKQLASDADGATVGGDDFYDQSSPFDTSSLMF